MNGNLARLRRRRRVVSSAGILLAAACGRGGGTQDGTAAPATPGKGRDVGWPSYNRSLDGQRYADLSRITPASPATTDSKKRGAARPHADDE